MNSPSSALSNIIHSGTINFYPKRELELMQDKIDIHIAYCQHPICKKLRK